MSRKKIKKDVVKRKTNMYDPMGVYGRGLTQNQKLGMTRQMKIEYLSPPPERINQRLLEDYKKVLQFYKIPTVARYREISIEMKIDQNISRYRLDASTVLEGVRSAGYEPFSFVVNTMKIIRTADDSFPQAMNIYLKYGDGEATYPSTASSSSQYPVTEFAIPALVRSSDGSYTISQITFDNTRQSAMLNGYVNNIPNDWTALDSTQVGDIIPFTHYNVVGDNIENYSEITITLFGGKPVTLSLNVSLVY